jgi:hypothetical protein
MFRDIVGSNRKAMDTAESGNGLEFINTAWANTVIPYIEARKPVINAIRTFTMPSNPYKWPVGTNDIVVYHAAERTTDSASAYTASDAGTDNITFDAAKLAALTYVSEELDEDSIVPILPYVRNELVEALGDYLEKAIMRGDEATGASANINKNDGTPTTGTYYLAMDGMAKLCIDGSSGQSFDIATLTAEDVITSAGYLGKYAANPGDCPILTSMSLFLDMLLMVDTNSNLVVTTVEKYGPNAPVITGELGRVFGFPILVTDNFVTSTEGESGEITTAGGTKKDGWFHFYAPGVYLGWRRNIQIESEKNIKTGQYVVVGTVRADVQFPYGVGSVVMGYDQD